MNKAVYLDRDGVLNEVLSKRVKFVNTPEDLYLLPGVAEAITKIRNKGYKVFVVTNQGGVGLGYMTKSQLEKIHKKLQEDLLRINEFAIIDEVVACIHRPTENCICRKPGPGMIINLANKYNISLQDSYMIGDREVDVSAGIAAGTKTILVSEKEEDTQADMQFSTLLEAAEYILNN